MRGTVRGSLEGSGGINGASGEDGVGLVRRYWWITVVLCLMLYLGLLGNWSSWVNAQLFTQPGSQEGNTAFQAHAHACVSYVYSGASPAELTALVLGRKMEGCSPAVTDAVPADPPVPDQTAHMGT